MLVGTVLGHNFFRQVTSRAAHKINFYFRIGILKCHDRLTNAGAGLAVNRHLALLFGRGDGLLPILLPVTINPIRNTDIQQQRDKYIRQD